MILQVINPRYNEPQILCQQLMGQAQWEDPPLVVLGLRVALRFGVYSVTDPDDPSLFL